MRIPRIYTTFALEQSDKVVLDPKAQKHIKDVLRMQVGDSIILFNGDGHDYSSVINEISKKEVHAKIISKNKITNESPLSIHLLQPLCRSEKMDWCLQKATELGVTEITPYTSKRVNISIAKDRLDKKLNHWNSVAQSACEQSGRSIIPVVNNPVTFYEAVSSASNIKCLKIIASPEAKNISFADLPNDSTECICAIGPEGGFEDEEIKLAQSADFSSIQLGPRILRLETAVITVISLCQSRWGDLN